MTPTAIALGNFDGIHLGHLDVLGPVISYPYCQPTVVTFDPHPRQFFSGKQQKLLTPTAEKVAILQTLGIVKVVLLPFDADLATLSGPIFVKKILLDQLNAKCISVGENFCFGYQRQGTVKDLEEIVSDYGVDVVVVKLKKYTQRISSSQIRTYLAQGELHLANQMLGRQYSITGKVIQGQQLGRTIGFPTANIEIDEDKLLPRFGVYSVRVAWGGEKKLGVLNIGIRPTVQGEKESVEVHILDWSGDIYGERVTVTLEEFIRPEIRFESLTELKHQIEQDCQKARQLLNRVN